MPSIPLVFQAAAIEMSMEDSVPDKVKPKNAKNPAWNNASDNDSDVENEGHVAPRRVDVQVSYGHDSSYAMLHQS